MTDKVRIGGLMRCCIETVNNLYEDPAYSATEGDTLQCRHTDDPEHRMRFRDGGWEWDHG